MHIDAAIVVHTDVPCKKLLNRSRCRLGRADSGVSMEPYVGWGFEVSHEKGHLWGLSGPL